MESWTFIFNPMERYMTDYKRIFDAWEDGGMRGIVVGRMFFVQDDDTRVPAFGPDPKAYQTHGVELPPEAPRDPEKEKLFGQMLDDAASRGWHIMVFDSGTAAHVQSLITTYPQVNGVIIDGPGENHYELAWHHGGKLFELRDHERSEFAGLGFEVDRLERGIAHLDERFHNLTPDLVRYHAPGGMLAGLNLFDINEDALYWLRSRQEVCLGTVAGLRRSVDRVDRKVELGLIPRITTFSSLTGQNYQQMAPYLDYIFPKHYYWHRGFDGMYGTIARWVQKFLEWNPSLTEEDGFALVKCLFGLELPGVHSLADMEMGFPEEFFSQVVYSEARRALDAVQDDDKVVFWVSTGRSPHAGDAMTARDLQGILQASKDAGAKRFLFHPDPDLGAPEWHVISRMCGNPWLEDPEGYWPSDTWHQEIEGYGSFRVAKSRR